MKLFALPAALLCVSCALEQQSMSRIEFDKRARDIVRPQVMCAERKVKHIDNGISDIQSVALALAMHCRHEYQKATEDYARLYLNDDEQRSEFREKRNNIQEKIEAFLPFVVENRVINCSQGYLSSSSCYF
ncbi:MAG: hypothetical protein FWG26_00120 [Betaproteobacteria bacterium]|nr:hypothetical protein [Betaproteobacteria bacterium]